MRNDKGLSKSGVWNEEEGGSSERDLGARIGIPCVLDEGEGRGVVEDDSQTDERGT